MTSRAKLLASLVVMLLALLPQAAVAQCKITSVNSVSITGFTPSSYTASTSTQTLQATLSVTVTKVSGNNSGCTGIAFSHAGTQPLLINGASQIPFTLSGTSGGSSILFQTGGTPGASLLMLGSLANAAGSATATATVFLTITGRTNAEINAIAAGNHTANLNGVVTSGTTPQAGITPAGGRAFSFTLNVLSPRSCTVGGFTNPAAGSATIPISNGRVINTTPIIPTFTAGSNVVCTGAGAVALTLTSQNTRLTGPANANAAFANAINYTATVSVAGGTAATYASTSATSTPGTTGGTSGALSVSITPIDPGKPLVAGAYNDVLTISITPQ